MNQSESAFQKQFHLTAREFEVIALCSEGLSNKLIARRLGVGTQTVKSHVSAAMVKLGVPNRAGAAAAFIRYARPSE